MDNLIIDIFYKQVVLEATTGRIDCQAFLNIIFATHVEDRYLPVKDDNPNLVIPTLEISNKNQFDELLVQYVMTALDFYDDEDFTFFGLDECATPRDKMCLKIKVLLSLLWSNATFFDFQNPYQYLAKKIKFYQQELGTFNLGYSQILDGEVFIALQKDLINFETPIKLEMSLVNGEERFYFPTVNLGIADGIVEIYSLKNRHNNRGPLAKKVNRLLYKVNENFNEKEDYLYYGIGPLKDITPSFAVMSDVLLAFLGKLGYNQIKIISFLPERWNAKEIMYALFKKYHKDINEQLDHDAIQENITNKFLRYFIREANLRENINISQLPNEITDALEITIDDDFQMIDNKLLDELNILLDKLNKTNGLL